MAWTPSAQETLYRSFPETPSLSHLDSELYSEFLARWERGVGDQVKKSNIEKPLIVLVRGIFGSYMPGHFSRVVNTFSDLGYEVRIAPTKTAGTVRMNVQIMSRFIEGLGLKRPRLIYAHSKGGLEVLHLLKDNEEIRETTRGVILCQTPRGPSPVLESVFKNLYEKDFKVRIKELAIKAGIGLIGGGAGCRDLIDKTSGGPIATIKDVSLELPVLQVSSWSLTPTTWLDSYHERLGQIRPNVSHDGQFYTEDLIWPQFRNLCLGSIDHAQLVVGGEGLDEGKLWSVLHSLMTDMISAKI